MYTYEYPMAGLTADVVLFSPDKSHILCIVRKDNPCAGQYALPGGFLLVDNETLREAAVRELYEETSIELRAEDLRLVGIYDKIDRDPRSRVISSCYTAHLKNYRMPKAGDDAAKTEWVMLARVLDNEIELAFDHHQMVLDSIKLTEGKL